jgi:hypothetical protein
MEKKLNMWQKLIASFDNSTDGFSARKLSAFIGIVVAIITTMKFVDQKVVINAIEVWLIFSLLCLGIITAQQIVEFRKGGGSDEAKKNIDEAPKQ